MKNFSIRGENYHWIDNERENETDLCLHGHVTVTIGGTVLEAEGTVSATALYLLKSITEDHIADEDIQMIPCCGHFFCPDEAEENVTIIGCDTGLDWTITHEGDMVVLALPDSTPVTVKKQDYIAEVLRFAYSVERYYGYRKARRVPEDPYERKGYAVFWDEWHRRYYEAASVWMLAKGERTHTIIETHSNVKENDISDVHLHDCEVTSVLQDGEDLIFFLPEGITVWRETECNPTKRHLQTGAAEIRFIGIRNPQVIDAPQYEIISHRYHPAKGVMTLDMIPGKIPSRADTQKFRLLCQRVEYRFDTYTGDASFQRYEDGMKKDFENSLCAGRGSAYLQLRYWMTDKGRKEYVPILAAAMCRENRFDRQGNRDRTTYLLDLYDLFAEPEKERILRMVLDRHMQISYDDMTTYAPLLKGFAGRGVTEAGEILEKLYNHYRTALEKRTERPDGFDELGSMAELLAWELDIRPHSWEQRTPGTGKPETPMTMETIMETVRGHTPEAFFHPARYRAFLQKQPPAEITRLAEAAMAETDPEAKALFYSLFHSVDFPGDPTEMLSVLRARTDALGQVWYEKEDKAERQRCSTVLMLVHALARLHHPAVRELGLELAEMSAEQELLRVHALELWCSHFEETADIDRLSAFLERRPAEGTYGDKRHSEDWAILYHLYSRKYEDPRMYGFLTDIFLHTYCSSCRHTAVKILAEHGMLPEHIRKQCLWDCEPETRKLAMEMEGKTI